MRITQIDDKSRKLAALWSRVSSGHIALHPVLALQDAIREAER